MGTNYEKGIFKQLQDVMLSFERLSSDFAQFKIAHSWEIGALKEGHRQEKEEMKACHKEEISRLESKIAALECENAILKTQLKKDSNNSSKPPSSDSLKKSKPQNS